MELRQCTPCLMLLGLIGFLTAPAAWAHPHVFVDGGVDFVLRDGATLEAVEVIWLYDEFETLYTLSAAELELRSDGTLAEEDRLALAALLSDWPDDFDGSAHLSVGDDPVALGWPQDLEVQLLDGRLEVTFTRALQEPLDLRTSALEVAFYESTYFFAFTITYPPKVLGAAAACATEVIPFNPDIEATALQTTLFALSREETPTDNNVGALFADRIRLQCE